MGKKKQNDEAKKEKPIFGSGAEPSLEPKDDGLVKCVCTVPCVWRGYHDEGDKVMVERKRLESDAFLKGHFKACVADGQQADDSKGGVANGEGQGEGEGEGQGEGEIAADENGQGELGLK